jgi:FkbM family methyltransferase
MRELEDRIVAHHVGGRGFGVALNCPVRFSRDIVNILYEADEKCALEMIAQNTNDNFHVLPYCLGLEDGPGRLHITNNPYASSNLRPNPEYDSYYCEVKLAGEIDGVPMQDTRYDAVYGNENKVVEVRDVMIRSLDTLVRGGKVPGNLMPDFISLDTQGSELDILRGAEVTFRDHCIALATEVEFHPMYEGQALFSGIFDFALRHGFYFAGFTYLQEISPKRMPVGARAKGFLAFGDALFLRRIDSVKSIAPSPNEQHLMLLKLAFVALNFGYLEYALLVLGAAAQVKPDSALSARLTSRDCYRLLHGLRRGAEDLPADFLHTQRSELVAERRKMLEQGYLGAAKEQAARGRIVASRLGGALHRRLSPVWHRLRNVYADLGAGSTGHRTTAPAASLTPGALDATAPPPSIEDLLESYGYSWLAYEVRRRRRDAERYVAGRLH